MAARRQAALVAGAPGGTTPVRLIDDDLASSLSGGGRLDTLLSAVGLRHQSGGRSRWPGRAARPCLAVDPDLLVTVNAMTAGYAVNDDPGRWAELPDASRCRPGRRDRLARPAEDAGPADVRDVVGVRAGRSDRPREGRPTLALPAAATTDAADVVDQILGIQSVRGATLLGDGPLTDPALRLLSAQGPTVAIAAGRYNAGDADERRAAFGGPHPCAPTPRGRRRPVRSRRWRGAGRGRLDPDVAVVPRLGDGGSASNTIQPWHVARTPSRPCSGAGCSPSEPPRTQILMPPLVWDLAADDASAIFTALATSIQSGLSVPRPLSAVIAETAATPSATNQPLTSRPMNLQVIGSVRRRRHDRHRQRHRQAMGSDRGAYRRPPHGSDRHAVHRAAARGHAARTLRSRCRRRYATTWRPDASPSCKRRSRSLRRSQHRQPRRLVHAGNRAQPPAAGPAQRPPRDASGYGLASRRPPA